MWENQVPPYPAPKLVPADHMAGRQACPRGDGLNPEVRAGWDGGCGFPGFAGGNTRAREEALRSILLSTPAASTPASSSPVLRGRGPRAECESLKGPKGPSQPWEAGPRKPCS